MRRRAFLAAAGGVAATLAATAKDRPKRLAVLGTAYREPTTAEYRSAWAKGLAAHGFDVGRNLEVLWRETISSKTSDDEVARMVEEIIAWRPDCISTGGEVNVIALMKATREIPVVANTGDADPVQLGIAASYARPGGNFTGIHPGAQEINSKRVQVLQELAPGFMKIAWIAFGSQDVWYPAFEEAARSARLEVRKIVIRGEDGPNFAQLRRDVAGLRPSGCIAAHFHSAHPPVVEVVAAVAREQRLVISYSGKNSLLATEGFLFSYDSKWQAAGYANEGRSYAMIARVLRGERPAVIAFEGPVAFDLHLNLKTAARLGIEIPPRVRISASEVIQ